MLIIQDESSVIIVETEQFNPPSSPDMFELTPELVSSGDLFSPSPNSSLSKSSAPNPTQGSLADDRG